MADPTDVEMVIRDFRLTRRGRRLKIESLDYHAEPLWLSTDELAELGLLFESDTRQTSPRGRGPRQRPRRSRPAPHPRLPFDRSD